MAKKIISVEITEELKERLRVEAFHRAITISALIRELIEEGLKTSKEKRDDQRGIEE